jgi:ribosomal 50S subunit-associated protein YjgA (DUF615 family)
MFNLLLNIKMSLNSNKLIQTNTQDPDEQFILDIIKTSKIESIDTLLDSLRLQESKSILLMRLLERYKDKLHNDK